MRSRPLALLAVLVVLCVAVAGCGDDSGSAVIADMPEISAGEWTEELDVDEVTVDARDHRFVPENLVVSPGTTIRFDNVGRAPHNVIPVVEDQFDQIDAKDLQPGDQATIVLDEPGEYPYYCSLHGTPTKGMIGRIRVEG